MSGRLHLELPTAGSGALTSLDMAVGGGVAVWEPRTHRLRVLLVEEALNPSAERQMSEYLESERLADSGRARAVLEMHFRSNAKAFDRDGLESASLTVTNSDGTVSSTADVLDSLKWSGSMPASSPSSEAPAVAAAAAGSAAGSAEAPAVAAGSVAAATSAKASAVAASSAASLSPTLELTASGGGTSAVSPRGHDSWQLSVAIPVTQAP